MMLRLRFMTPPSAARTPPRAERGEERQPKSFGKIELLGAGVARAAQGPVVAERGGHVAELDVGHDHALYHGREPAGADLVDVVGPVPVELLRELDLLVG